jgi:carbonic anhydrase
MGRGAGAFEVVRGGITPLTRARRLHGGIGRVTTWRMSILSDIQEHNVKFVQQREYEPFLTDVFPDKKLVVLTCMDTRLVELLPRAMNIRNGDAKIIKNAGAIVSHPFGSVMRSLLVAVYELMAAEVAVVGHYGCGMTMLSCDRVLKHAKARGVSQTTIQTLEHAGIDLHGWLKGFDSPEEGVRQSVEIIRRHPLLPRDVPVHGLMIDPQTGRLDLLSDGYKHVGKD